MSAKFSGQLSDEFLHDGIDLLVTHRLLLILKDEVHGVRLLAGRQFVAFVDVEEFYSELHTGINQQGEVAADGWELGDLGVEHLVLLDYLHQGRPVQFCVIDGIVEAELLLQFLRDDTHLSR